MWDIDIGERDTVSIHDGTATGDVKLVEYPTEDLLYVSTTGHRAFVYMDTKSLQRGRGFFLSYKIGEILSVSGLCSTLFLQNVGLYVGVGLPFSDETRFSKR